MVGAGNPDRIGTNCDCGSDLLATSPRRYMFGPRCPCCHKILGPISWSRLATVNASGELEALAIYREMRRARAPIVPAPLRGGAAADVVAKAAGKGKPPPEPEKPGLKAQISSQAAPKSASAAQKPAEVGKPPAGASGVDF